ncbi:MAG: hypothetical protein HRT35_11625 [Algicola sp.]|nr:hypothetical protein [Algicola sp.]
MGLPKQTKPESRKPFVQIPAPVEEEEGLGDLIKKVTAKIGIKACSGCKRRAAFLNRFIGFTPVGKKK